MTGSRALTFGFSREWERGQVTVQRYFEFTPSTPRQLTPSPLLGEGWGEGRAICQHQLPLVSRHTDDGKRAPLSLTPRLEKLTRLGRNGQHITFLAFVAPDFLGGQAGLFE